MDLRNKYQDKFEKLYGVRLGFMSFFVKAAIEALKRYPTVNASIDDNDIVYHGYFDIGVAVSSPRGLVVPVLRDADQMNLAEIEKAIGDFVERAKDNSISIEEMTVAHSHCPMAVCLDLCYPRRYSIHLKVAYWVCIKFSSVRW